MALFQPRRRDATGPNGTDPRYLGQSFRVVVNNRERVLPERVDDAAAHARADSLDQPRAEIALHALQCGRQGRAGVEGFELQPCLGSLTQKPEATIASPGCRSGSVPTTVTKRSSLVPEAGSVRSGASRATV